LRGFQNRANRLAENPAKAYKPVPQIYVTPKPIKRPLKRLKHDLTLLFEVSRAWLSGEYQKIPFGSMLMIAGGLLYFISPFDAIPDFIPVLGFVDDAFVLALIVNQIRADLGAFESWKLNRPHSGKIA